MSKVSWLQFFTVLRERLRGVNMMASASTIAYFMLLSLFPLTIVIGNLLPYLPIDVDILLSYVDTMIPANVIPVLEPIIRNLLTQGSIGWLSLGTIATLWSAGRGIRYLQDGFHRAYGVDAKGNFVINRLISTVTIILILLLFIAFSLFFGLGASLMARLGEEFAVIARLNGYFYGLKWPVTAAILFVTLSLIYVVTPNVKLRVREVLPGAAVATIGWLLLVETFTLYVRLAANTLVLYGSLSAFFVLLFWLNFASTVILFGALLNAVIREFRHGKPQLRQRSLPKGMLRKKPPQEDTTPFS